jgi:zinc protease
MERYDLGFDYLQRHADLVNAVTVDDIQEVARTYLDPEVYALAIAGPDEN